MTLNQDVELYALLLLLCCFHVKDLHRLCDHWTGVNLSIDTHYKRLVEQDVCVFCEKREVHYNMQLWMCNTDFGCMLCLISFFLGGGAKKILFGHVTSRPAREWLLFLPDHCNWECDYPLTLTEKHILWKIPEGGLYHIEVTTAHTVHECWQEVCRQAAAQKTYTITSWKVNGNK